MRIRDLRTADSEDGPSDIPRLQQLYSAQGFSYNEPDWTKMGGQVLEDDDGTLRLIVADRKTAELYMLADKTEWATPGMKWTWFERLHEAERKSLKQRGYEDAHNWVPRVMRSFAHKLRKRLGWSNSSGPDGSWTGLTRGV